VAGVGLWPDLLLNRHAADGAGLTVDLHSRRVTRDGVYVLLTPAEFELVAALAGHRGRPVTQRRLMSEVFGCSHVHDFHRLIGLVARIRAKLERDPGRPRHLLTEAGIGYRLLHRLEPPNSKAQTTELATAGSWR
jgi:DNA-binding response OmpR family regulator